MIRNLSIAFILLLFNCIQAQTQYSDFTINSDSKALSVEDALSQYIQFESVTGSEKEAGEWLKKLCIENGLYIKQMGDTNGNYNLAASLYPLDSGLPNIVLLNHIDVVPSGDITKWTHPPFSGLITDTEIWGRGAFDNKGNGIMHLFSLIEIMQKYKDKKVPYNVTFLAVSCEETQCNGGAGYVAENYFEELNPIVILGEGPPAFNDVLDKHPEKNLFAVSITNKRPLWLELSLKVKTSGHGSITPAEYANKEMITALHKLLSKKQKLVYTDTNINILKQLGALEGGFEGLILKHPRLFKGLIGKPLRKKTELFSLFSNSVTLTSVDSYNNVINVIPDEITALLDCRLLPTQSNEVFIEDIKKALNNKDINIKVINQIPIIPPSDDKSVFFEKIEDAIQKNYPKSSVLSASVPNYNDVGFFRAKGINAFCFTPIRLDRYYLEKIHNINERIPIHVLTKGVQTYVDFLESCLDEN
ncbi:M20/M25/M40 family metallo-hydrolase [Formosa sp. A9]|uniref:M20/M25/M40 family metallo-hydrolase n=1 Tax=Formosa sp. A9 TaxID=3442641 RepID=UPI003EBEA7EB